MDSTYLSLLGHQSAEQTVKDFLGQKGVRSVPRPKRGESTTNIVLEADGIELIFSDSEALDVPNPALPEGALVLSNITFCGIPRGSFKAFAGRLPLNLRFGAKKAELIQGLGSMAWSDDDLGSARWDKNGYCVFADFDEQERLVGLAVQLPVA